MVQIAMAQSKERCLYTHSAKKFSTGV